MKSAKISTLRKSKQLQPKSLNSKNELPILKSSILSPLDRFDEKNLEKETIERLNMQYVKDYHPLNDLAILIKGLKKIDQ